MDSEKTYCLLREHTGIWENILDSEKNILESGKTYWILRKHTGL